MCGDRLTSLPTFEGRRLVPPHSRLLRLAIAPRDLVCTKPANSQLRSARCRQREAPATRNAIGSPRGEDRGPRGEDRERRPARAHRSAVLPSHAGARQQPVHAHTDRPAAIARVRCLLRIWHQAMQARMHLRDEHLFSLVVHDANSDGHGDQLRPRTRSPVLLLPSCRPQNLWCITHPSERGRANEACLSLPRPGVRARAHRTRAQRAAAQLSAQARARCSVDLSAPCCRSSAGARSLALAAPLHALARPAAPAGARTRCT
jgi:hypothetical protein